MLGSECLRGSVELAMTEMVMREMVMMGASGFHVRWVRMGHKVGSETGSIMAKESAERLAIKAGQTE